MSGCSNYLSAHDVRAPLYFRPHELCLRPIVTPSHQQRMWLKKITHHGSQSVLSDSSSLMVLEHCAHHCFLLAAQVSPHGVEGFAHLKFIVHPTVKMNGSAGKPSVLKSVATGQSAYRYRTPVGPTPACCSGQPAASVGGAMTTVDPWIVVLALLCQLPAPISMSK